MAGTHNWYLKKGEREGGREGKREGWRGGVMEMEGEGRCEEWNKAM